MRNIMICEIDEFLLIVQNWITDSATVMFSLILFDAPKAPVLGVRLRGRIGAIDKLAPAFTFVSGEESFIVVDLAAWSQVGYADSSAYPKGEQVKEGFVIARPGASIAIWVPLL
jgi:hypothetical protein